MLHHKIPLVQAAFIATSYKPLKDKEDGAALTSAGDRSIFVPYGICLKKAQLSAAENTPTRSEKREKPHRQDRRGR
ncbi:hypothetical protein ACE04B_22330, partial [Rhizobium phaseoli]